MDSVQEQIQMQKELKIKKKFKPLINKMKIIIINLFKYK